MTHEIPTLTLNSDQDLASSGFFEFLLGNDKEMIISGPGGTGKTFLMGHMIDNIIPQYDSMCQMLGIDTKFDDVIMTATTNKAAEVLSKATGRPTSTIHAFLNLKVVDDYTTGKSKLTKTTQWRVHERMIIFVDECSMIDSPLRKALLEGTLKCKIIYVGDHCQLSPVMESLSPIYQQNLPQFGLSQQMRNCGQPALMDVCNQLRDSVETGVFKPIKVVPGVIDLLEPAEMEQLVNDTFREETTTARILAYTNKRVIEYNNYIREIRGQGPVFQQGETLINNSAIMLKGGMLSVEAEVKIIWSDSTTEMEQIDDGVELEIRMCGLEDQFGTVHVGVKLPEDRDHFNALVKYYGRTKNWNRYFYLKNTFPDLRPREAATVHKAQGSTYDDIFIDLTDLSTCTNPNMAARLLYVAFSRARNRVVMFGTLADRFGGLTT